MRRHVSNSLAGFAWALAVALASAALADESGDRHFTERVWPVLKSRCVSCHGPDAQEGSLRLDSRAAVLRGGKQGPAVSPDRPQQSLLLRAVLHEQPKLAMPPKEKLSAGDVAILERWIRDGAPWPSSQVKTAALQIAEGERLGDAWHDARNPIVRIFRGERLDLWSLKKVERPALPAVKDTAWPRTSIDHFILARLEAQELAPSREADRRTLARRLYFDLLGLPPSPEEMQSFLADPRPDAYERLVEELLASPRYGQHTARMWLDVVRYSDSNGFDWDEFRPRAWLFRDYVVRSLNADKPYDQFVREQLAGDELIDGPPRTLAEQDALIATTYLRLGPQDNSSASFDEQDRSRAEWMADLVETTGSAFLGLTFSCCRCHDHKFDPLSQADHFRLRAFFEPLKYAEDLPLDLAHEQEAIAKHNAQFDAQMQPLEASRDKLIEAVKQRLREPRVAKLTPDEQALMRLSKEGLIDDQKAKVEELEKRIEPSKKEVKEAFTSDEKTQHEKLEAALAEIKGQRRQMSYGLLASDASGEPAVTRILYQGDYKAEREPVEPGFISAIDPNAAIVEPAPNGNTRGRRLALAKWIVSAENPLTARVLVNRVWQMHFGRGLVATSSDFGLAGSPPTHPELLDWLADEFVRQSWSLKELHRLIVTSAVYRQASSRSETHNERDAANSLYARQNLRRLSAEQLRDSLLAVSGLLNSKSVGFPVWPELPVEVLQANPAFLDDNAAKTKGWYPSPAAEQDARSVYLVQKRTVRVPFLELFDLPENTQRCGATRPRSRRPLRCSTRASAVRAAQSFAQRVEREAGNDPRAQVERAFALGLQRAPSEEELAACRQLLEARGLVALCRVVLNLNELIYVD